MKHVGNLTYPEGARHKKKRIGRGQGSGRGGTSTRGHKGQKSRAGSSIPSWFEGGQMPLNRRVPKFGFSNHRFRNNFQVLNLLDLQRFIDSGKLDPKEISQEILKSSGLISSGLPLKVLANGELSQASNFIGIKLSASAVEKIQSAGGSIA